MSDSRYDNLMDADHKKSWKCPVCNVPPKNNTSSAAKQVKTPPQAAIGKPSLRNHRQPSPSTSEVPVDVDAASTSEIIAELRMCREEMQKMRIEMQQFNKIVSDLTEDVKKCNIRIDECNERIDECSERIGDLSARVEVVERQQSAKLSDDTADLERKIAELQQDINYRDQELLSNDIEIAGIPETNNEQGIHLVLTVANKLGVSIEEGDVVSAERAGPVRREEAGATGGPGGRPRPLVVRLTRRAPRDRLLAAARVRRDVTTDGMGLAEPARRFYVNERLTRHNRQLFHKAREDASRMHWKYVWTRDGAIFARKDHGLGRYRLRTESDLPKVFGCQLGTRHDEFVAALTCYDVDIMAINETWLRAGQEARAPAPAGYRLRHVPRAPGGARTRGGGVGFYIKRGISLQTKN
ncbi:uncharacterized protein LOC125225161 [Leguminivora glycinivorella]|uniref:uncharacterized protein LOC125225161 n=1 Tax=Leguminivora glycinivorella TaxID=1035111 RepID=UPI00200D90EF|nr:uncharacterized protein LOC125225161 [Leguminivora glycinivorella]